MRALNPAWDEPFGGSVTEVPRLTTACACLVCGGGATTREYFIPPSSGTASNGKTIYSWDEAAAQLTRGGYTWSSTLGGAVTVTYGFRSTAPSNMPDDTGGFSRFNESQIIATIEALALWSDVANITFVRVGSGTTGEGAYTNSATMLFANYSTGVEGAAAFAYLPSPGATGSNSSAGDVWVNVSQSANANPVFGDYGPHTLAHEIGHAIGLRHPSDYDGGSPTYGANAAYWQDARMFTIMSYFGSSNTGGSLPIFSVGPQLHDIAAAQRLYGPNMTTRTGNTTYGFNSNTGHEHTTITSSTAGAVFAIWDAGGIDTLDLSGYDTPSEIDLREEAFSGAGPGNGGGVAVGNISIARGAVIENAVGGAGNDTIIGNSSSNVLLGNAGDDAFTGGDGDDVLVGGAGGDALNGGNGFDTIDYSYLSVGLTVDLNQPSNSTGDAAGDTFTEIERVFGSSGDDTIRGSTADLTMFGFAGNDALIGGSGYNTFIGGAGADFMDGGGGYDTVEYSYAPNGITLDLTTPANNTGEAAGDTFANIERFIGTSFADIMRGSAAGDILIALGGDDQLFGLGGEDYLFGGLGADHFDGGADYDSIEYSPATAGVGVDMTNGALGAGEGLGDTFASIERIIGSYHDDRIQGGSLGDNLIGLTGNDILLGGDGNDALLGFEGADVLSGGNGFDTAEYSYSPVGITIDLANPAANTGEAIGDSYISIERVIGTYYGDVIFGSSANDVIAALHGNDVLSGGDGDDVLLGGPGADQMEGGPGFDSVEYSADGAVTADLANPAANTGNAAGDTYSSIERLIGSYFSDVLAGTGGAEEFYGLSGSDQINGRGGDDTIFGGAGADFFILQPGSGADTIMDFEDGLDLIDLRGYAGATFANTMVAAAGADVLLTFFGGETALLKNMLAANITDADFLFS